MYRLLRAVFSAIRLLRYCDSSKPVMNKDKVYYLVKRTTAAIEKSIDKYYDTEADVPVPVIFDSGDDNNNEEGSDDNNSDR